jgi:hypothetical protein
MSDHLASPGLTSYNAPTDIDFSQMCICGLCFGIAGPWRYLDRAPTHLLIQECTCTKASTRYATWPRFDFNEAVTLCRCCGLELLRSGSKWSVWFCGACKERVRRLHQEFNVYLIPIGRHSIMGGFGLRGDAVRDEAKIEAFATVTRTLFARMDLLEEWANQVVQRNMAAISGDRTQVPLTDYLTRAYEDSMTKQEAFTSLIRYFEIAP